MVGVKKFGWIKTPSAWQQAEAWRVRRAAFVAREREAANLFSSVFVQANQNRLEGQFKLATGAALKRVQMATKAKFDQIANIELPKGIDKKV